MIAALVLATLAAPAVPPTDLTGPRAGAVRDGAGVASRRLRPGRGGPPPLADDIVTLDHRAWKRDGTFAGDSTTAGLTIQPVRHLMPGLVRVVEAMTVGETRRVWIPAALTHRRDDDDPRENVDLTVDVTLAAINRAPPGPRPLAVAPPSARRTASGLAYRVLRAGRGDRQPSIQDRVTVAFSVWSRDGALYHSTLMAGQPASVRLLELPAGLREGLQLMRVGEKARFWVPAALAYGEHPRRGLPAGALTYDVELIAVP